MQRYTQKFLLQDLAQKMVFIGGPRQAGKTTLSKAISTEFCKHSDEKGLYLNWDSTEDKQKILKKQWHSDAPLIIFDELHKYPRWKQWIKGVYDTKTEQQQFLVTGSARLDVYWRGGDSLMGRYHYWRLHPLTLDELPANLSMKEGFERLMTLGGFPEPFLSGDERLARRWRRERFDRILQEDIRDLELVRHVQLLSLFVEGLRERAGSLIILSNLAEDLQISPKTAKNWLTLIERMYIAFPIYPLTKNIPRSIQKPPKVYFYDNADVTASGGARLENLVATTLLKRLHFIEDYEGYRCSLHYIRDKDGREVDFVTVIDGKVIDLIEVKLADTGISSSLRYYSRLLKPQNTVQLVANLDKSFHQNEILVTNLFDYFKNPPWSDSNSFVLA
jgi:predicted AAA+ superfamily ATPase